MKLNEKRAQEIGRKHAALARPAMTLHGDWFEAWVLDAIREIVAAEVEEAVEKMHSWSCDCGEHEQLCDDDGDDDCDCVMVDRGCIAAREEAKRK